MTTQTQNALTWKAYRDGDRWIIGAAEWQEGGYSMTYGIATLYCDENPKANLPRMIRRAQITPLARCEELKQVHWTNERFETACDKGAFGAAWE
jgi:hypothetical protein